MTVMFKTIMKWSVCHKINCTDGFDSAVQCALREGFKKKSTKKWIGGSLWWVRVGEAQQTEGRFPFSGTFFFFCTFHYIIFMFFLFFCIITFLVHQIRKSSGSRLNGKPEVGPHGLVCTIKVGPVETICALYEGQYNRPCFLGRPIYILLAF